MEAELKNLQDKGTFEETNLPAGRRAIGSKWVFKLKRDADGNPIKYKARLVAQGFSQLAGIDFEDTFAPVGRITSLRILLTMAATYDLKLHQADVEGAYLNGNIDVELYMDFPDGSLPLILPAPSSVSTSRSMASSSLDAPGGSSWAELSKS
jgi:hypothetical protein